MPNLDRTIRLAENKLAAVERREMWALTGSEKRKLMGHLTAGSARVVRHKSTGKHDSAIDQLWENAARRLQTEISATRRVRDQADEEKATAKAKKRAESKWW